MLLVSLRIYGASSLKDRRQVVRSLLETVKNRQNFSVADLGPNDVWEKADLAFSCVGSAHLEVEQRVEQLLTWIEKREESGDFELIETRREIICYDDIQNRATE